MKRGRDLLSMRVGSVAEIHGACGARNMFSGIHVDMFLMWNIYDKAELLVHERRLLKMMYLGSL